MSFTTTLKLIASALPLAASMITSTAYAADIPPVYVSASDGDDEQNTACNLRHAQAVTTVQGALRNRGVKIGSQDDYFADRAMVMYVSLTALRQQNNSGEQLTHCAAYVELEFSTGTNVVNPVNSQKHWASISWCNVGTLFNWRASEIQGRASEELRDLVGRCLDKYTSSIRN